MNTERLHVLLADDDRHDRFLFGEALGELPVNADLITVSDGEELMKYLYENTDQLPDIVFLDLNMCRKNGFECLAEIKQDGKLKKLEIVIFSTSYPWNIHYNQDIINIPYKMGTQHYIRKPNDFEQLKKAIYQAITTVQKKKQFKQSGE